MAKKNFFIEILDNGYILHKDATKSAVEKENDLKSVINMALEEMLSPLHTTGIHNVMVRIEVETNLPESK